jgi:hypothetical protein
MTPRLEEPMVSDHHHDLPADDETTLPDTPYEHRVCYITLISALIFMASGAYYFLSPDRSALALNIVMIAGALFALGMANFFAAAFCGKLCGRKDK